MINIVTISISVHSTFPSRIFKKIGYFVNRREVSEFCRLNSITGLVATGPSDVLITHGGYSYLIGYSVE